MTKMIARADPEKCRGEGNDGGILVEEDVEDAVGEDLDSCVLGDVVGDPTR